MTETPTDDQPGFVAEEPEHCHACYRLIQPGQTYYLTIGQAILCEACIRTADAIRVTDDLVVVVEDASLTGAVPRMPVSHYRGTGERPYRSMDI